ncbi:MAG TPA: FecR domain-containing protein, partial [Chitinophagaceae bacterium]|nr:FecR domain-containing protein [Chitinophagaceae bacterium]
IHDEAQPFQVVTQRQTVQDIGTHFNIEAYPEDSLAKTTLLEGAARVVLDEGGESRLVYPGEQALVNRQIRIRKADTTEVVAWKNGQFVFRSTSLRHIMQQIARWYDVDVVYENDVSGKSVWGSVSRYADVSEVLKLIELTGVAHFKTSGRKIIVTQ